MVYIIIFLIQIQNDCERCTHKEKKSMKWTTFDTILRRVNFILMFFEEWLASLLRAEKPSCDLEG